MGRDGPSFEQIDGVGAPNGAEAVGDDDEGDLVGESFDGGEDPCLGFAVKHAGGLVENEYFRAKAGLYLVGDGAGTSRGITAAWASGLKAADGILASL